VREHEGPNALLYFGGNAEDVSVNLPDFAERFPNHALYLMHYRGYGGSEGKPSETAIMEDAFALFDEVAQKHAQITVAGRSLGTGVAVRLAAKRPVSRVALVTPYDSIEYVAKRAFPYVPVRWLLKDKYESWRYAPQISAPTLILMADADEVIPAESTERLHALFREGVARLLVIPDTRHNSIAYSDTYQDALTAFVNAAP
jgi:pimeloyl-ACP methyl ester carboxylesterase